MRICVNGVSRDMTPEEEAEFVAMREQIRVEEDLEQDQAKED